MQSECVKAFAEFAKDQAWKERKKNLSEGLKRKQDYVRDLQKVFNQFIRLRDKDQKCISCGAELKKKYDAGHYYSVGNYPYLRFNEDNVHAQCVHCNQHRGGNLHEYSIGLKQRIGVDRYNALVESRHNQHAYDITEIIRLIDYYKQQIKILKNDK